MEQTAQEESAKQLLIYMTKEQLIDVVDDAVNKALERQKADFEKMVADLAFADPTVKGGKAIAEVLGIGETSLLKIKQELIERRAIYYEGRSLRGSRSRLLQYRNECMIG